MQKLLAIMIAALAVPTVLANHGTPRCQDDGPAIGIVEITPAPGHTYYVDDSGDGVGVYRESNGIEGLQRPGGASPYIPDDAETCFDENAPSYDERIL